MHSFPLLKTPTCQVGAPPQASQAAPHVSQGAVGGWSAHTNQQCIMENPGLQLSQSNNFTSQNKANPNRQMANWQSSDTSHLVAQSTNGLQFKNPLLQQLLAQPNCTLNKLQYKNIPAPTTCASQTAMMQNSHQYLANQSRLNTAVTRATQAKQNSSVLYNLPVSFNEAQTNRAMDASHLQQGQAQQIMHSAANRGMKINPSLYTPAPSVPYEQMVIANTVPSAAVPNGQTQESPNWIYRQGFSHAGYCQNNTPSYSVAASQPLRNNSVATQCILSNAQGRYASNTARLNQQSSAQYNPSYNSCGGYTNMHSLNQYERNNFLKKTNNSPLNHDAAPQTMLWPNVHAGVSKSYANNSNPTPAYNSTSYISLSQQNFQTATTVDCFKSYYLNTTQSLPLHSGQPLAQSVTSRAQHTVNATLHQNSSSNALSPTPVGNGEGVVVLNNEMILKRCSVVSLHNTAEAGKRVLLQGNKPQALAVSHSNKNIGMLSPFKQNDSGASSMSGHVGIRAIAVVPPLAQDVSQSPTCPEPFKSVDDTAERCFSPDIAKCPKGEANQNQLTSNIAAPNDGVVLTISDSESKSSAQTTNEDNHESAVQRISEASVSKNDAEKKTEGVAPQSSHTHELSLLPTRSWTRDDLTKLILEMDEAQPKPKDTSKHSSILKILFTLRNDNTEAFIQGYKGNIQNEKLSELQKLCNTHINQDTVILTQIMPDFKDQLKQYDILKEGEVYSEPPYKSLWLNVNDQLDDIDKEFGFPWTLKRHLNVDENEDQGHYFKNIPEQAANEEVSKVFSPAESGSVDMTDESKIQHNPSDSTQETSGKSSCDSSYCFEIKVLPPEEAKIIFEQEQQKSQQSTNGGKATVVSGSLQREESNDMAAMLNEPKVKTYSDNKLEEICCLARFIEMNAGLGKSSSHCQCRDKLNAHEDSINTLKPDPEHLPIWSENVCCQTITQRDPKLSIKISEIIDLTDDGDDQLISFFGKEPEPILQTHTSSQLNAVSVRDHKDGDLSEDFCSTEEMRDLTKDGESEREHVQEALSPRAVQSNDFVSCTQLTVFDPSKSTETKGLSNQEEHCQQTPVSSHLQPESPSENENQTQVTNISNQRPSSVYVKKVPRKKRQSNLDCFFPSITMPKKCRLPVASNTSQVQYSASEVKTVELVLFGTGQQHVASSSEKGMDRVTPQSTSSGKNGPPEVLSLKLKPLRSNTNTVNSTRQHSAKQLIYEKWRRSIPTTSGSGTFRHKNKLRKQTSLPAIASSGSTKEEELVVSPKKKLCGKTRKYIRNLKKMRALSEGLHSHELSKRSYSVTSKQPGHQQGSEMQNGTSDDKLLPDSIVLKFSVLPKTFNLTDGSLSDTLEPEQDKNKLQEKAGTKSKDATRTWYPSSAKQYEPLRVSKNDDLFYAYQKKYKEKTVMSTDE